MVKDGITARMNRPGLSCAQDEEECCLHRERSGWPDLRIADLSGFLWERHQASPMCTIRNRSTAKTGGRDRILYSDGLMDEGRRRICLPVTI